MATTMANIPPRLRKTSSTSYGTFGHPWEYSICVIGAPLLERVAPNLDDILVRRIRVGGKPLGTD
jgi:Protein of unknown function (DUF2716)